MSHNMNRARLILLALLLWLSPGVFALGLGNIKVESYLNEPLVARVDLLVRPGEDISGVTASLASAEDFALIGASRDAISVPLRFTVDTQTDQPFVRVTSNLPVNAPVVRLIIELNWASGRLLREYTVFLDPPTVPSVSAPPPVIDQRREPPPSPPQPESVATDSVAENRVAEDRVAEESNAVGPSATEPSAAESGSQASQLNSSGTGSGEDEYGPVQSGDTLWRIASNWADGSAGNVNQVMLAIQRNNPQAFINNNINLLKRGAILRMPSAGEISAISAAAAREEVTQQEQDFVAGSVSQPSQQTESQINQQGIAPAVETPLVDVASEMSSASQSVPVVDDSPKLEIVPPSEETSADSAYGAEDKAEGSSASTSAIALQEELARKEEALITEQQTNEYLQQRIQELESQVEATGDADLVVEDEELAAMESRLRDQRQAADDAAEGQADAVQAEPVVAQVNTNLDQTEKAWYQRWTTWVIALLVLAAAAFGWVRSRRGDEAVEWAGADGNQPTVPGIKGDSKEIIEQLDPADRPADELSDEPSKPIAAAGESDGESDEAGDESPDEKEKAEETSKLASRFAQARYLDHEEAHVLDEDSADPEIRLDLARAYISMGDREAARAILGEVVEHGDEAQKAEAQDMLAHL